MKKYRWHILAHESPSYDIARQDALIYRGKVYQILSLDFQNDSLEQCKKVRDDYCKNANLQNPIILRIMSNNCHKLIKGEFEVRRLYKMVNQRVVQLLEVSIK